MKAVYLLLVVALVAQICTVTCSTKIVIPDPGVTTTTKKPKTWGTKIKNGIDNFLRGAAVVGVVGSAFGGRGKHKPAALPPKA